MLILINFSFRKWLDFDYVDTYIYMNRARIYFLFFICFFYANVKVKHIRNIESVELHFDLHVWIVEKLLKSFFANTDEASTLKLAVMSIMFFTSTISSILSSIFRTAWVMYHDRCSTMDYRMSSRNELEPLTTRFYWRIARVTNAS